MAEKTTQSIPGMDAYAAHLQDVQGMMERMAKRQAELDARMAALQGGRPSAEGQAPPAEPWLFGVQLTPGEVGSVAPAIQLTGITPDQLQPVVMTCLNAIFNAGPQRWPTLRLVVWCPLASPAQGQGAAK